MIILGVLSYLLIGFGLSVLDSKYSSYWDKINTPEWLIGWPIILMLISIIIFFNIADNLRSMLSGKEY